MSTYPLAQSGALTLPSGAYTMRFHTLQAVNNENPRNVAGASEAETDSRNVFVHGLRVQEFIGQGVVKKNGAETYGLAQSGTLTLPSSLDVQGQVWTIRRVWPLFDATGSGNAAKCYTWGMPRTILNCAGVAKSGYIADHATNSIDVSALLNQVGTLAGTLKLSNKVDVIPFMPGGHTQVRLAGEFSGPTSFTPVTSTGTNDDFEWALGDSVDDPVSGTFTIDMGDATNLTPNVLVYDITLTNSGRDGGEVGVTCRMRVSL